jgi:hypothetical protein
MTARAHWFEEEKLPTRLDTLANAAPSMTTKGREEG